MLNVIFHHILFKKNFRGTLISRRDTLSPKHCRGPAPNGKYVPLVSSDLRPVLKRSGSNICKKQSTVEAEQLKSTTCLHILRRVFQNIL